MPSLTSLSALFLLCLCMCPNYLCSAKELGAQTQELLCLLAMPTQGELCRGWHGRCPEGCWGCGSCGWETLLCLELTACSQALRWGGLAQYSLWLPPATQDPGVPHSPVWLGIRRHQGAGVSVCLSLWVCISPGQGELGLPCPQVWPWRSWDGTV